MADRRLTPRAKSAEEARERRLNKNATKSKTRAEKSSRIVAQSIRQIYAEFLAKQHSVKVGKKVEILDADQIIMDSMIKIFLRGESCSVALMEKMADRLERTSTAPGDAAEKDKSLLNQLLGETTDEENTDN